MKQQYGTETLRGGKLRVSGSRKVMAAAEKTSVPIPGD
jgi:hypothetical protein